MLSVVGILFLLIVSAICSAIDRKVEKAPQLSVCPKLMQVMQQDIFLQKNQQDITPFVYI